MNKKINSVLFFIVATAVNILTMAFILFVGMYLVGALLPESAKESMGRFLFVVIFLIAVAGSFFIYNRLIKFISKRIDMGKYFPPIFKSRGDSRR